jgi:hypothetical protein
LATVRGGRRNTQMSMMRATPPNQALQPGRGVAVAIIASRGPGR